MVTSGSDTDLAALADRIGHHFTDESLLRRALAHRSWCAETPGAISNERLEFLGDAVLGWAIADMVYHRYDVAEGQLTDLRKSVVNAIALAEVAQDLDLGPHILLGRGKPPPVVPTSRRSCPMPSRRCSAPCTSMGAPRRHMAWSNGW